MLAKTVKVGADGFFSRVQTATTAVVDLSSTDVLAPNRAVSLWRPEPCSLMAVLV